MLCKYLKNKKDALVEGQRSQVASWRGSHPPLNPDDIGDDVPRNSEQVPDGGNVSIDCIERRTPIGIVGVDIGPVEDDWRVGIAWRRGVRIYLGGVKHGHEVCRISHWAGTGVLLIKDRLCLVTEEKEEEP